MKILVIGSGGREHAICLKLSECAEVEKLYCAPSNAGISAVAECVAIGAMEFDKIVEFVKNAGIDLTVVAPDNPLAEGLVDLLEENGLAAFGPRENAAVIEGSKVFSKDLMKKYNIPTARYEVFGSSSDAIAYAEGQRFPLVIKAEGLALGKGVIIAQNLDQAKAAIVDMIDNNTFGEAGRRVVIEEFLRGREVSVLAFCDGANIAVMPPAQDHKKALDGDKGLNTGGMGAFTPVGFYTEEVHKNCMETIYLPTVAAMAAEGREFKGVLYFGLMLTDDGMKVIEYNARFGDPEAQVILPRLKTSLVDIMLSCINGTLDKVKIEWEDCAALCVIMASGGYPGKYATGYEIKNIELADEREGITVFHAGTKQADGKIVTGGGRVLCVTAKAATLPEAAKAAYEVVELIDFENKHYRKDIGQK